MRYVIAALLLLCTALSAAPVEPNNTWERQTWQTENGLPQNTVHAILQSRTGFLWIATEGGLARFDGYRFQVYSVETQPALPSNDVRALAEGPDGAVWAATSGGAIRIDDGVLRTFETDQGLPASNVSSVFTSIEGKLIAATANGDAAWDGHRFALVARQTPPAPRTLMHFSDDDALSRAGVLCQMMDREGNIWIGTETGGLTVLRLARFNVLGQRQGLPEDSIRCVFAARDGSVWIGTNNHGLSRWKNGKLSSFSVADGLSSDVIISLGEDPDGNLVVGTPDGLNIFKQGKVTVLTSADGLADDLVRSVANDGTTLYVGTRRGLTAIRNGDVHTYTEADGLGSNLVGATLAADGALWIATLHGLSQLRDGKLKTYTTQDGLTSDVITALYEDSHHVLWIGTQGGSLNSFRNGRFEHFAANVHLPKIIFGIAEDRQGNLWLSSNTGIWRVGPEAVAYGTSDGLRINECSGGGHPALSRTADGTLWFATPRGLATMRADQSRLNAVPPLTAIESVRIDDEETPAHSPVVVPPGRTRFAFEYAGLNFVAPSKVRYRYKLDNFDKQWIDAGTRRVAFYTNVPPGQYRFLVMSRNNDGLWDSKGAQLSLELRPRFYQTLWFLAASLIAAALLVYGGYWWRVRQVAHRYDAVLAERNRIAREIHDTLAQGFTGVSVQLELISRLIEVSTDAAREHLNEARKLVRSSLNEARRSIWELRTDPGAVEDFAGRLSRLTHRSPGESVVRSSPKDCRVRLTVQGALRPLPDNVENELVRIAEEAVRNAQRHGAASEVDIAVAFGEKLVRLSVSDNGRGFDVPTRPASPQGHYGVDGMRERAAAIGGRFDLVSKPESGTVVTVEADV